MKRKTISILSLLCVLTLLFSLCSCSSGFKGKYRLKMIYAYDELYELGDTYQETKLSEDTITLTVNSDNTLILKISTKSSSVEKKGVWYKTGDNEYGCLVGGEQIYIMLDGNTVVIRVYSEGGQVIIFKK